MAGASIIEKNDPLKKVTIEYLFHAVRNPNPEIASRIRQLRQVKQLDRQQYAKQKKRLPYIVCGHFNPPIRKREYFTRIRYFILDIDHINEKNISFTTLLEKLKSEPRVLLGFKSPGEDGLKLMFKLDDYCYDYMQYSVFYRQFAAEFSKQYGLDQVLDTKTSDVSRACFISSDPDAWYNPQADPVIFSKFIDISDTLFVSSEIKQIRAEFISEKKDSKTTAATLPDDIYAEIRQKLNPRKKLIKEKNIYVPHQLEAILLDIVSQLNDFGLLVEAVTNIHYGKKIAVTYSTRKAEINLFYGKKGFTVVESPKTGTDAELNSLTARIVQEVLSGLDIPEK